MKKLLLMVVMLLAVVTLTACRDNLDAFELLERSHETEAHISGTAHLDADITMSMEGMTFDMPMTMRMEVESEERMRIEVSMSIPMEGEMSEIVYLRDGYVYTDENGTRTRSEVDADAMDMADSFNTDLEALTEAMIEDSSAERTDDGYRLEFILNQEGVMFILDDLEMGEDMFDMSGIDEEDLEESNNVMVIYMDEDYRLISSETTLEIEFSMEEMGISMDMSMDMLITIEATDVTINFPDWLDEVGNELPGAPIAAADLIGVWEWEFGSHIFVFNADGTGIGGFIDLVESVNPDDLDDFTWEILNGNHIYIDYNDWWTERWAAVIEGNTLIITDLDFPDIVYTYYRTDDSIFGEKPETGGNSGNGDVTDASIEDLLTGGVWSWDGDSQVLYAFNPAGVGIRSGTGVPGGIEAFEWSIVDGNLHMEFQADAMFGVDYEMWEVTIENDVLTLESLQGGGTFVHTLQ